MKNQITNKSLIYANQEFEDYLEKLTTDLFLHCKIQGELDGKKNKPETLDEFKSLIYNKIKVDIQEAINATHKIFQPVSGKVTVLMIEQKGKEKTAALNAELGDLTYRIADLQNEKKAIEKRSQNVANKYIEYTVAIVGGLIEAVFIYDALQDSGLSTLITLLTCLGLSTVVAVGIHYGANYIRRSLSSTIFYKRCSLILSIALAFFTELGFFRANYYNDLINFAPGTIETYNTTPIKSGLELGIISFIIFCIALVAAYKNWRSDEDKKNEEALRKKNREVQESSNLMNNIKGQIGEIQAETMLACTLANAKYDYAVATERDLDNVALKAIEKYKEPNLRHRTDNYFPSFFSNPVGFEFIFFFYAMGGKHFNDKEVEQ